MQPCLLVKTHDQRTFLTYERNFLSLIEFCKSFKAEMYRATSEDTLMSLEELCKHICDPDLKIQHEFKKLRRVYPKKIRNRTDILKNALVIRTSIKKSLVSGCIVSLKELKKKYKEFDITDACLCNHFTSVRRELFQNGKRLEKVGAGAYKIEI